MRVIDAKTVDGVLNFPALIDCLAQAFQGGFTAPPRHHHNIVLPELPVAPERPQPQSRPDATLLLMPAWTAKYKAHGGQYIGIKTIAVIPDNGERGLSAVQGSYLLLSALTGMPLALIDAPALTLWRTAAASALASRYLSRPDAARLLMVGAGALAPYLIRAHSAVRPIQQVAIWNRSRANAEACAARVAEVTAQDGRQLELSVADDIEQAAGEADIISAATLSNEPLIKGAWLRPGVHLDTVGAFRPDMRETDDDVVRRARVYVDTRAGALSEAGDIVQPIAAGVIAEQDICGDLFDLTAGAERGRQSSDEITYFKSVGASLEDIAAAVAIYEAVTGDEAELE